MRATTALASRLVTTLRTTTAALASKPQPAQSLSLPLQGRHCLIAGGSGALGSSIAADMARAGARVTLLGRNKYKLHTALSQLQPVEGVEHKYLVMKTPTNKEFMNAIAAETKIDVLVNAIGIAQSSLLMKTDWQEVSAILAANLTLTIAACKAATKPLLRTAQESDSCIINMSSVLGTHGGRGSSIYAASKAGVIGLTRSLAAELGPIGIRVNCLVPGYIEAGMTESTQNIPIKPDQIPLKRYGHASEVAHAAMFLATNHYANNCVLNIDGGISAGFSELG